MARVTSTLLLLAGAVMLVTWLVAPASSSPQTAPASRDASLEQILPVLDGVNLQVERLRERLVVKPAYPPPARDPFNYRAPVPNPAAIMSRAAVSSAPAPVAPQLVAILTADMPGGEPSRTAALSDGDDDVRVVAVGESIGSFVVSSIGQDVVVLDEKSSGRSIRLTLR